MTTSTPDYTSATACRSCGGDLLEVFDLGHQYPVCFPETRDELATLYPLVLCICDKPGCALVQLSGTVDPALLFKKHYWYISSINESMVAALRDVVGQAWKRQQGRLTTGDWVVDIGANDGTLLEHWKAYCPDYDGQHLNRMAVEPAPNVQPALQTRGLDHIVNDFFPPPEGVMPAVKAKVITAIAMAYDLPDPNAFFRGVADLLAPDGLFVCQLGYLGDLLNANAFDSILAEHVEYYSLTSLSYLLTRAGLVVEDVEWNSVNGGSIRCYIRHARSGAAPSPRVLKMISEEESSGMHKPLAYHQLAGRIARIRDQVRNLLEVADGEAYVYGASTKGLTTMQFFDFDSSWFQAAVERDPQKWGRWYGKTGVQIVPEEAWREAAPRPTLVLPWHFREAMVKREADWLQRGGKFVFPLPQVQVVDGRGGAK